MKLSSIGWQTETLGASRPETFRLPKAAERDPFFGLSRAFYYQGEQNNWWRLIRLRQRGKQRGITLVPFDAVARFVREQMETER
jgi:hypothetical protein